LLRSNGVQFDAVPPVVQAEVAEIALDFLDNSAALRALTWQTYPGEF
jgi:hypothetical protein